MRSPKAYAEQVLKSLDITRPEDLELLDAIAFERGAIVRYKPIDGAEARITIAGRQAIITISTNIADPRRRRFSVAHELGHFEMHRKLSALAICTSKDFEFRQVAQQIEQDANLFAASLLMPESIIKPLIDDSDLSLSLARAIADTFKVSLTAASRRMVEFSHESCAVVLSQDGFIRWFQGSPSFHEQGLFVDVKASVVPDTPAGLYFHRGAISDQPRRVQAEAWLRRGTLGRQTTLLEQSIPLPNYRAVLTLLLIDEDSAEDDWRDE